MNRQLQSETRTQTIFRHTQQMLHETSVSFETFSQHVVEHYHQHVTADRREVQFKTAGDIFDCARANSQKLRRYMDGDVSARLCSDLEESWVMSLRDTYRTACLRDLSTRYGLLPVPIPTDGVAADLRSISALVRESAESMSAVAGMLEDGRVDGNDAQRGRWACDHLIQVQAVAASLQHAIEKEVLSAPAAAQTKPTKRARK